MKSFKRMDHWISHCKFNKRRDPLFPYCSLFETQPQVIEQSMFLLYTGEREGGRRDNLNYISSSVILWRRRWRSASKGGKKEEILLIAAQSPSSPSSPISHGSWKKESSSHGKCRRRGEVRQGPQAKGNSCSQSQVDHLGKETRRFDLNLI